MDDDGRDLLPDGGSVAIDIARLERDAASEILDGPRPLPRLAYAFYMGGGCLALALALGEVGGGLAIELRCTADGHPQHAYAVAGAEALDARGGISLARARCGAPSLVTIASPNDLLIRVGQILGVGRDLRALTFDAAVGAAARRAARCILAAHPGWSSGAP